MIALVRVPGPENRHVSGSKHIGGRTVMPFMEKRPQAFGLLLWALLARNESERKGAQESQFVTDVTVTSEIAVTRARTVYMWRPVRSVIREP